MGGRAFVTRAGAGLLALVLLAAAAVTFLTYIPQTTATMLPVTPKEIKDHYDLVVVGGDPEGVAAAVAGARQGLQTLLIDRRDRLGGLLTVGGLNFLDMNYGPGGEILTRGFFLEFLGQVEGSAFDTTTAANVFHRLVNAEESLTVALEASEVRPLLEGRTVVGVSFAHGGRRHTVTSSFTVDATQDADLAHEAGVTFTLGQEDFGGPQEGMAATLVFEVEGVGLYQWQKLWLSLNLRRAETTGAKRRSAWGFPELLSSYHPRHPGLQLRGLNIGRQNGGTVLINALQIFGVDPFSRELREEARRRAEAELPFVIDHLRRNVPGFERASLAGTADELYIRESRHMVGEYRLTIDDVLENRDFPDRIAFGSYPVDIQATRPGEPGTVVGVPDKYAIPFRCLVPREIENLLVVGRSASFDSLAHGSARVVPIGMNTGQAAGTAAALALREGVTFRQLARDSELISRLQALLGEQGLPLAAFDLPGTTEGHLHYEGLRFVRSLGLAAGGYRNDYGLDGKMPESEYMGLMPLLVERAGWPASEEPIWFWEGNDLTLGDVAYVLHNCFEPVPTKGEAVTSLRARGLWTGEPTGHLLWDSPLTRGEVYTLLQEVDERLAAVGW